ncbi:MAG TPA: hemerythrin domain-containing protein [Candidatus Limnocylindrales bacterium]|nr:hemerythrin domain-containing protein [Candidatus Limnocylindrales bacterium]
MAALLSPDRIEGRFLEDEHRRIRLGLEALEESILELHRMTRTEVVERITRSLIWLRRDLLPHAAWEEAWIYPRLDLQTGSPWTTRALRIEHQQIRELAGLLETQFDEVHERWSNKVAFNVVAALARLDALITSHFVKEERFVLPLLDSQAQEA